MSDPDLDGSNGSAEDLDTYTGYEDPVFMKALAQANQAGAALSIVGSFCVMVTFFVIRVYLPKLVKRVSLRLALAVAVSDLFSAVFYLVGTLPTGDSPLCSATIYLNISFVLMSMFSTAAIALNILLVFVLKLPAREKLERRYYIGSGISAFVIPLVPLVSGRFGWNDTECWYKWTIDEPYTPVVIWQWTTYYGWVMLVIIFCTTCTFLFWLTVRHPVTNELPATVADKSGILSLGVHAAFDETDRVVRRAISRIKYYCAVPVVTHFLTLAADIEFTIRGDNNPTFWLISTILLGLHGFVNALVFFVFDPSVERAYTKLRLWILYRYYLRYFRVVTIESDAEGTQLDQNTSVNRAMMTRVKKPENLLAFHLCRALLVRDTDVKHFVDGVIEKRLRARSNRLPVSSNVSMARISGAQKGPGSSIGTDHAVDAMLASGLAHQDYMDDAMAAL
ncbi:hypothetical protein HDU85_001043 [Gaertneriomyces sp. JEL0708]|nr:hypothetical protein HDU85_001043 [Gaertneriomyces sp. JEL0708]